MNTKKSSLSIAVGVELFYPEVNGVVTTTMNLLQCLKALGHRPCIITPQLDGGPRSGEVESIPVHYIPSKRFRLFGVGKDVYPGLRVIRKKQQADIGRILREIECDVVHITAPWLICRAMLREGAKLGIPRVHTVHTNLNDEKYLKYLLPFAGPRILSIAKAISWKIFDPYVRLSSFITTPGHSMYEILAERYKNLHIPIEELPNGIDTAAFLQEDAALMKSIAPYAKKGRYGIFIGRIGQEKSIDVLLRATALLHAKAPDFQLVLVGDGPFIARYKDLAAELGISGSVHFLGKIPNSDIQKSGLVKNARFFATASLTEVQSMTVIEAICSCTPLVLADHLSMTHLARDAAAYARPNDAQSFADTMFSMLHDEVMWKTHKKAAEQMRASFDGMEVAKKFVAVYEKVLQTR